MTLYGSAEATNKLRYLTGNQVQSFVRDGFVQIPQLIPPEIVAATSENICRETGVSITDDATWGARRSVYVDLVELGRPCRVPEIDLIAEDLCGPNFLRGGFYSPVKKKQGMDEIWESGFAPILNFPVEGPQVFEAPVGYHIDGDEWTTRLPSFCFLILLAYLTDAPNYGGATAVRPGSHRQVFEHWTRTGDPGNTVPPDLDYLPAIPLAGRAGDVNIMHYLMVHNGSRNTAGRVRIGLNSIVQRDPDRPYGPRSGAPDHTWTPMDLTLAPVAIMLSS